MCEYWWPKCGPKERNSCPLNLPQWFLYVCVHSFHASGPTGNVGDPSGFSWASGEYRCALYNHYMTPNSDTPDCIGVVLSGDIRVRYTPYGYRTARSSHPGGVNVLLADGSLQFVLDDVSEEVWEALATKAGGETVSN